MASSTWRSKRESQRVNGAILAPIDDVLDIDELAGDGLEDGLDPQYADLPCYVPLIDDEGLEPFALDVPPCDRH